MITFHVAADGGDRNPGTREKPFATLARAKRAVRKLIAAGLRDDVTVLVGAGRYELEATLDFGPEDSGTARRSITYAAAPGAVVVISVGRRVTGWRKGRGKLWTTRVPGVRQGRWYFRQLFVNGRRAVRARTPNVGRYARVADALHLDMDLPEYKLWFKPGSVKKWRNLTDVEGVFLSHWEICRKRVKRVDTRTGEVAFIHPHMSGPQPPQKNAWCFFENAIEFLDSPGEWYLDRKSGVLSYWPRKGEDVTRAEVIAPRLENVIRITGSENRPVRNVHFKGLRLEHADWPLPEAGYVPVQACFHFPPPPGDLCHATRLWLDDFGAVPMGAAVRMEFAESCSLEDGAVAHVGGTAVHLLRGCSGNLIRGNRVFDAGGDGVFIGEYWRHYYDHYRERDLRPSWAMVGNRVSNNQVHHCGQDYYGGVGIGYAFASNTTISHNLLHHLPYTGISAGFIWSTRPTFCRGNRVEYNHIRDVMQRMGDGGGIYTLGCQPGTVFRGNLIHDVLRGKFAVGAPNNGFFTDEGSKGFLFERNIVFNTAGEPVRRNDCKASWHAWRGNIFGRRPGAKVLAACGAGLEPKYRKACLKLGARALAAE